MEIIGSTDSSSLYESEESFSSGESVEPKDEVLNFTSNDEIDSIFCGEENIDIVGYVDDIQYDAASEPDFKRYRFYKIVVNNGQGRRIQVTAWNERSTRIFHIDRLYTLVHLTNLTAQPVHKVYNLGNIHFELLVQNDSDCTSYGRYEDQQVHLCRILDAMNKIGSQIRIEAYIKTPVKKFKNIIAKTEEIEKFCLSSITDGTYMMDLRLPGDAEKLDLKVGRAVSVIGVVLDEHMKPPKFYVENLEDVKIIPGRQDMPLQVTYLGSKYPKRVVW